jgi:hypothetical protein
MAFGRDDITDCKCCNLRSDFFYDAAKLVADNLAILDSITKYRIVVIDMDVTAANRCSQDSYQYIVFTGYGLGDLFQP